MVALIGQYVAGPPEALTGRIASRPRSRRFIALLSTGAAGCSLPVCEARTFCRGA